MSKSKLPLFLFAFMVLTALEYSGEIIVKHGFRSDWPNHAKYHIVVSGIQIAVIALSSLLLAFRMTKDAVKQIWAPLAVLTIGTVAAWPVARWVTREPTSWEAV